MIYAFVKIHGFTFVVSMEERKSVSCADGFRTASRSSVSSTSRLYARGSILSCGHRIMTRINASKRKAKHWEKYREGNWGNIIAPGIGITHMKVTRKGLVERDRGDRERNTNLMMPN